MSISPKFSIITPVYNTDIGVLREMLDSVIAQTFQDWEHILVDDHSPNDEVRDVLLEYQGKDPRFRVLLRETNGHIVKASNDGLALATGEFISLLDHDDLLEPDALQATSDALADEVDYVYTDEDKVDMTGRCFDPFHKPDWSPERFRGHMYVCHFSTIRAALLDTIGGFREGYDGSQDHDLILRVTEAARKIVHIRRVLYHWRIVPGSAAGDPFAKPYAWVAGRKAVEDHLRRVGIEADVDYGPGPGYYRLKRHLDLKSKISVLIPTRGSSAMIWGENRHLVVATVRGIEATKPEGADLEYVVVYDRVTPDSVLDELRQMVGDRLVLVEYDEPFNFSRKMNLAALHSTGARFVLMNDDIQPINDEWLAELVAPLDEPGVGMTGATLLFADGTLQHAGHRYHDGDHVHVFRGRHGADPGPWSVLWVNREMSGVTAACAGIKRDTYFRVGGFCESLPINFNDVDLSMKVRSEGLRIVQMVNAQLYHFESKTRAAGSEAWERALIRTRWGNPLRDDYLPSLT